MKKRSYRLVSILLALLLVICLTPATVFATLANGDAYAGEEVTFLYTDKNGVDTDFGMFTRQGGTTCEIKGDKVIIHYVPKNITVYVGIHWGTTAGTFSADSVDVELKNGALDIELDKTNCGKLVQAVAIKETRSTDEAGNETVTYSSSSQLYLAIPTEEKIKAQEPVEPGDGSGGESTTVTKLPYSGDAVAFYKEDLTSTFGMLTPQDGSYWALDGDNVVIHIIPKNTTIYSAIHWGAITDDPRTKDVDFNADGTIDLKLAAADYCGYAHPVAPVKAKDGGTTSDQYYLAVPAKDKLRSMADVQADLDAAAAVEEKIDAIGTVTLESEEKIVAARKAYDALTDAQKKYVSNAADLTAAEAALEALKNAQEAAHTPLTVTNKVGMFKVVEDSAFLDTAEDGSKTLVFALNGSGYSNLFKGTYEEAKANGADKTKWIVGEKNADGKLEFKMPVKDGETYIPVVAISNSYLEKYEAGQNPIERAFFPRQFTLDATAKTLLVEDYKASKDLEIINEVKMFKPTGAKLTTVGGPNSNDYATTLDLAYGSVSFDKAFIGNASDAGSDKVTVVNFADGAFSFKLRWVATKGDPTSVVNLMDEPFTVSFHSVSKDTWYERVFTVSENKGTLTITEATKQDEDAVVKVVSVKDKNGKTVAVTLGDVAKENELTKPIAVKVNAKVENEESINIEWQKDLKVPAGTEFPVTIEFEYKNKDQNFYMYHFDGKDWKVVGEGKGGKATVTFDSLSPTALVSVKNPNTGDASDLYVWAGAFVVFAAAAVVLAGRRRKEEK